MCEICHMYRCPAGCPNAPEPPAVHFCKICDEAIRVGEEFYEMDGKFYHEECLEDNAVYILIEDYGASRGIAEEER